MTDHAVYILRDAAGAARYVGVTRDPVDRLKRHVREAKGLKTHRGAWIRSMLAAGAAPTMEVVEWTSDWSEAERRWIKRLQDEGADLTNGNAGGFDMRQTRGVPLKTPALTATYRLLAADAKEPGSLGEKARAAYATIKTCERLLRKLGCVDELEARMAKMQGRA